MEEVCRNCKYWQMESTWYGNCPKLYNLVVEKTDCKLIIRCQTHVDFYCAGFEEEEDEQE